MKIGIFSSLKEHSGYRKLVRNKRVAAIVSVVALMVMGGVGIVLSNVFAADAGTCDTSKSTYICVGNYDLYTSSDTKTATIGSGSVSYNASTKFLTLNNYSDGGEIKINVPGSTTYVSGDRTNTVSSIVAYTQTSIAGNLTISGKSTDNCVTAKKTGSVNGATVSFSSGKISFTGCKNAIYGEGYNTININGSTVGDSLTMSFGTVFPIAIADNTSGNVNITNGTLTSTNYNRSNFINGVYEGRISLTGGTLNGKDLSKNDCSDPSTLRKPYICVGSQDLYVSSGSAQYTSDTKAYYTTSNYGTLTLNGWSGTQIRINKDNTTGLVINGNSSVGLLQVASSINVGGNATLTIDATDDGGASDYCALVNGDSAAVNFNGGQEVILKGCTHGFYITGANGTLNFKSSGKTRMQGITDTSTQKLVNSTASTAKVTFGDTHKIYMQGGTSGTSTLNDYKTAASLVDGTTNVTVSCSNSSGWQVGSGCPNSSGGSSGGGGTTTPTASTPSFSPNGGSVSGGSSVTISSTSGATIYYTTDGSNPSTSSNSITSGSTITLPAGTTCQSTTVIVKAYAVKSGYYSSSTASKTFTIDRTSESGCGSTGGETTTDKTAPTGKIEVEENSWKKFMNTITFGLLFQDNIDVTITGSDASGIKSIQYFTTDTAQTEANVKAKTSGWTTCTLTNDKCTFSKTEDGKYIIYAKITDNANNYFYLSSDGLVKYSDTETSSDFSDTVTYKKGTDPSALDISLELNGNTIGGVKVAKKDGKSASETLSSSDYSVANGKITISKNKMKSLGGGKHTFIINVNPQGTNAETQELEVEVEVFNYEVASNNTTTSWTKKSSKKPSIRVYADYEEFEDLYVSKQGVARGSSVATSNYTVSEGSTVVTLNDDYVNNLDAGTYDVTMVWSDGTEVTTQLTIAEASGSSDTNEDPEETPGNSGTSGGSNSGISVGTNVSDESAATSTDSSEDDDDYYYDGLAVPDTGTNTSENTSEESEDTFPLGAVIVTIVAVGAVIALDRKKTIKRLH